MPFDLHLMIFGDSTATGYGCASADEVPGVLIARGLAEAVRQAHPAEHQGDRRRHVEGSVRPDRRDVRGGPAAGRRGDHDRRQRHHQARTASARRRAGWAARCAGCAPAAPSSSSAPARTSASSPRSRSRCAGWRAAAGCGWRARRPSAVRAAGGVPVPFSDLLAPEFRKAPELLFSPTTCSTRRRPDMRWRPSSCCLRCVMRWASSSVDPMAEEALESRSAEGSSLLARVGNVSRLWRRSTGVPAPIVVPAS